MQNLVHSAGSLFLCHETKNHKLLKSIIIRFHKVIIYLHGVVMAVVKIFGALLMLVVMGVGTFLFGLQGFVVTLVLSIFVSWSISKREKEALEQKRHDELMQAMKNQSSE